MKNNSLKIILIFIVLLSIEFVFAQTPPANRPPAPPGLPIDGGVFTLALLAFGYGVKKLKKEK